MFEFNIVESIETGERAYYVNAVRFDRQIWRACMEAQINILKRGKDFEVSQVLACELALRGAQSHMEGKATFDLPKNYRAFYREVVKEIRDQKREHQSVVDALTAEIEDLTDKLED